MNVSEIIKNPYKIFESLAKRGYLNCLPDKVYIKFLFRARVGSWPNIKNPRIFNEKLQWLKLYNRRPEYTLMVDKYLVRDYVKEKIGEEYLIPLLGVWNAPEEIDFDALPNRFVLKCNHNSGLGMCICKDKNKLNYDKVREELTRGLAQDYYLSGREWPYKNVPRKIIAEQYMEDETTKELRDYKFYCFDGIPKFIMINSGRGSGQTTADYYDMERNCLDFTWGYPHSSHKHIMPENFELMKRLATALSVNIPHVRVDFYEANGQVYFGELTFFDGSGFDPIIPASWDVQIGNWLTLPEIKC